MKKKTKTLLKGILPYVAGAAIGITIGFIIGSNAGADADGASSHGIELIARLLVFVSLLIGFVLHIVLHEAGHLAAGLLSGYKFTSFSIGSIMIIKKNGKLNLKRFAITGAGGQCLMSPPEPINNTYPFALYYLGGGLMNFIASGIFFALFLFLRDVFTYAGDVFIPLFGVGLFLGLLNILPLKLGGLATDGSNVVSLVKSGQTQQLHWRLLTINARISSGERTKNLPEEWFVFSDNYDFNNTISANFATMGLARLIDRHDFVDAKTLAERILAKGGKLIEVLKNETRCELLFLEIMSEPSQERQDKIERLFTPKLKKYIAASKTHLSKHRLMYAYEKLVSHNDEKAKTHLLTFNKKCLVYPYAGDRESEKELIAIVDDLAARHPTKE